MDTWAEKIVAYGANIPAVNATNWSNFDHSNHKVASIVFAALAMLFVAITSFGRLLARFVTNNLGLDDLFITLSAVFAVAFFSLSLAAVKFGQGQHIWDIGRILFDTTVALTPDQVLKYTQQFQACEEAFTKLVLSSNLAYGLAIALCKFSLLFSYRRFFQGVFDRQFKVAWYVVACSVASSCGAFFIVSFLQTIPIQSLWDWDVTIQHRINIKGFYIGFGVVNALNDLAIWALPLYFIHRQILYQGKFRPAARSLIFLFTLGLVALAAAIIRCTKLDGTISTDITYDIVQPIVWSEIELAVCIICANLPPCFSLYILPALQFIGGGFQLAPTQGCIIKTTSPQLSTCNPMERHPVVQSLLNKIRRLPSVQKLFKTEVGRYICSCFSWHTLAVISMFPIPNPASNGAQDPELGLEMNNFPPPPTRAPPPPPVNIDEKFGTQQAGFEDDERPDTAGTNAATLVAESSSMTHGLPATLDGDEKYENEIHQNTADENEVVDLVSIFRRG